MMSIVTTRATLLSVAPTPGLRRAVIATGDEALDDDGVRRTLEASKAFVHAGRTVRSPTRAAAQTADLLGRQATPAPALAEWDLGAWRGRTLRDITSADPSGVDTWVRDPDATPHHGESLTALLERVKRWLTTIADTNERLLVVTHPAIIRSTIVTVLEAPPTVFWKIDISPLTTTDLAAHNATWRLRSVNHRLEGGAGG